MRKNLVNIIQIIVFLCIGLVLAYLSLKDFNLSELFESFRRLNFFWIIFALILGGVSHIIRAYRWNILLNTLNYKPSLLNSTAAIYIAYFVNLVVPRMGEIVRCSVMYKNEKIPIQKSLGTVITDRIIDVVCLIFFTILALILEYSVISEYFFQEISEPLMQKLKIIFANKISISIFFLSFIAIVLCFIFLVRKLSSKFLDLILGFKNGLFSVLKLEKPLYFIFLTILMWILYFSQVYIMYQAYNELQSLSISSALVVFIFGSVAMIVTPGGIGAYPKLVGDTLSLYGVSAFIGASFGWFVWLLQTIFIIIWGLLFMVLLPLINKN